MDPIPAPAVHENGDEHAEPAAAPVQTVLEAVRDSALRLLSGFPRPPATLRIQAGDVTVEAVWATPAVPVPVPVPVSAPVAAEAEPAVPAPAAAAAGRGLICSPTVGTFYRSPEPGAPPFVEVGDTVQPGQQVAIVETMKLMIPVKADRGGQVAEILKDDHDSVEHGEPLLALTE